MITGGTDEETLLAVLRRHGKRVTVAKRTVADVLLHAPGHLTADALTNAVQERHPDVSPSTVYRILEEFESLELVVHAHVGQQAAVYHLAGVVHAHLTCQACDTIFEIPASAFDDLSARLREEFDFELDRHHVALSGTCAYCRRAAERAPS